MIRLFYCSTKTLFLLLIILLCQLNVADASLPFDQRRLLLVKLSGGAFPPQPVVAQILDDMRKNGRFEWVLASQPQESIKPVEVPSDFVWESKDSVKKMAQRYNVDGIIWLQKVNQEVLLKWYDGQGGAPLVFDSFFLKSDSSDISKARVSEWVSQIWSRFPGVGYVAKIDSKHIYVEGAEENALKPGMELEFLRIEKVLRHRLFKTIADIKYSKVGFGVVASVNGPVASVKIKEQSSLDPVKMGDRYGLIDSKAKTLPSSPDKSVDDSHSEQKEPVLLVVKDTDSKIGEFSVDLSYGKLTHSELSSNSVDPSLSRNAPSVELKSMAFVTSKILGWAGYRFRFSTFNSPGAPYTQDTINATLSSLHFLMGYKFDLEGMFSENKGLWIAPFAGYRKYSFSVSDTNQISTYGPTAKKWNGLALGVHLRFPIDETFHTRFTASKSMFISFNESEFTSGGTASPSAAEFEASLHKTLNKESTLGLGFKYQVLGVGYIGAGTRTVDATNISVKASELYLSYEFAY